MSDSSKNQFKAAVLASPEIKCCYRNGLQATGNYSKMIELSDTRKAEGSVNIDDWVADRYSNENRWDFVIGYDGKAYFIEVHPAYTSEIGTVLKKLEWLKAWLQNKAPLLNQLKDADRTPFYWMPSGKFNIPRDSRQFRQLASKHLLLISKLKLS